MNPEDMCRKGLTDRKSFVNAIRGSFLDAKISYKIMFTLLCPFYVLQHDELIFQNQTVAHGLLDLP